MGNFMDKIKNITGFVDPDDEIDVENEKYEGNEPYDYDDYDNSYEQSAPASPSKTSSSSKVVNMPTKATLQVVLAKPERFDDVGAIADHLNAKRTVVLNLESTNRDVSRRLIDFLSGVAYANGGQLKRVANSTFIITPYNVNLTGDLIDELENNGMFFQS